MIGVHSAKFPAEQLTANIREAVMRHGIQHPVVNDADFAIWNRYSVRAWPTVVLIDPQGKVAAQQAGEIDAGDVSAAIDDLLAEAGQAGLLNCEPLAVLRTESSLEPARPLRFPSKLLYASGDRLFIADTGHHRILEVQLSEDGLRGEIVRTFGAGEPGFADGPIRQAQFHDPHGLALQSTPRGDLLLVADTENHAVRAIDLVRETVRTIAGTGEKGRSRLGGGSPTGTDLRSPWALALLGDALLIAMAGAHQIWVLLDQERLGVFAGDGRERLVDGPRAEAGFNQPSDLALMGGLLFVADSEASAVRAITLDGDPQVYTLVGQGLFEFGDVDGVGAEVRLQHPTGIAAAQQPPMLYIADSYNHKVKALDPMTGAVATLIGAGRPGAADGPFGQAELYEPEGLALFDDRLYIADTNNHLIRVANLTARTVHTLAIR